MSKLLSIRDLLRHSVETGEIITLATGYGSRLQEIITTDWQRLRLNQPGEMTAPLWSLYPYTNLPADIGDAVVRQIHGDAVNNGALLVTTGTWIEPEVLAPAQEDWRKAAEPVFKRAVANLQKVTQQAIANGQMVWDIGAFGPWTDSHIYIPEQTPPPELILATHLWTTEALSSTKMLWGETACNGPEANAMAMAMQEVCGKTGKPWGINVTPDENGDLRDGLPIENLIHQFMESDLPPSVFGVNCVPPPYAISALRRIIAVRDAFYPQLAVAAFPNGPGYPEIDPENPQKQHWKLKSDEVSMRNFGGTIEEIADMGTNIIGGCCGTTCACGQLIGSIVRSRNERRVATPSLVYA